MSDDKIEEETYSLIFASLKHPIRRKILRMLANKPLIFSEILNALSIDSGHLSYHLDTLDHLIMHTVEGKYALSSVGIAAVKLMRGVEEYQIPSQASSSNDVFGAVAKVMVVVIIVALIASSLFYIGFVTPAGGKSSEIPNIPVSILPNQTFTYNITIVYKEEGALMERVSDSSLYMERRPFINTITSWEEGSFGVSFNFSDSYSTRMRTYDSIGAVMEEWWEDGSGGTWVGVGGWPITKLGTYRVEIENIGFENIRGGIGINVRWELYEKPYYSYGIAGLIIASIYPALNFVKWISTKLASYS